MVAPIWFSPVVYDYSSYSTSLQTLDIFNKFLLCCWMYIVMLMIFWTSLKTNEIEPHSALMSVHAFLNFEPPLFLDYNWSCFSNLGSLP